MHSLTATAILIISIAFTFVSAQMNNQACDQSKLGACQSPIVDRFRARSFVVAGDRAQLRKLCSDLKSMMTCVDDFQNQCIPAETRNQFNEIFSGFRDFLGNMCQEGSQLSEDYLKHSACMEKAESSLQSCVGDALKPLVGGSKKDQDPASADYRNAVCCGVEKFSGCVEKVYTAECGPDAARLGKQSVTSMLKPMLQNICKENNVCSGSSTLSSQSMAVLLAALTVVLCLGLRH